MSEVARYTYFKQSGNHAHALAPHCGSTTADYLKTATNKLEFSDLNESVTQSCSVMQSRLFCLRLLLKKCTYSTSVVLIEK